jgi:hypothetical protein
MDNDKHQARTSIWTRGFGDCCGQAVSGPCDAPSHKTGSLQEDTEGPHDGRGRRSDLYRKIHYGSTHKTHLPWGAHHRSRCTSRERAAFTSQACRQRRNLNMASTNKRHAPFFLHRSKIPWRTGSCTLDMFILFHGNDRSLEPYMDDHHPRSRFYVYMFYMSLLMAHTASCRTWYVTDDLHPRSRLYAYSFYVLLLDGTHGPVPYRICDGWSSSPITALCLQVLHVALDGTHGSVPYIICGGWSSCPITALCLHVLRVALDGTHAPCHTYDMWRVIIIPDHSFMLTDFTCRSRWHTRLHAIQNMWRMIVMPDHGFMPTGFTCRP